MYKEKTVRIIKISLEMIRILVQFLPALTASGNFRIPHIKLFGSNSTAPAQARKLFEINSTTPAQASKCCERLLRLLSQRFPFSLADAIHSFSKNITPYSFTHKAMIPEIALQILLIPLLYPPVPQTCLPRPRQLRKPRPQTKGYSDCSPAYSGKIPLHP